MEDSDFTSIQAQIQQLQNQQAEDKPNLMPFAANENNEQAEMMLSFELQDYLELFDWTGRVRQPDKRGVISYPTPKLLTSLRLLPVQRQLLAKEIQKESMTMLNSLHKVTTIKKRTLVKSA